MSSPSIPGSPDFDRLNASVRFAAWTVFARGDDQVRDPVLAGQEVASWAADVEARGTTVRGLYDVSTMRSGADLLIWLHGPAAEDLQAAVRAFRRTGVGAGCRMTWSAIGTHRPAEFSRDHVPSFMLDTEPLRWMTVYPFVRSYDWYLLPEGERAAMLREHGVSGRGFAGVQANTVAAFALGDYEWLLSLEADDLHELVDMTRALRATRARLHVRDEFPFHTGRRVSLAEAVDVLR
jgi:chlorite dismutase